MADQDDLSPPAAKRPCLDDDFPFGSDSLVTDTWDSNEYLGDDFPEAIRDIGSSISDNTNDNSNTALLEYDFTVQSSEHDLHGGDSGPSLQDLGITRGVQHVGDFYLLDEIVDDDIDDDKSNNENDQENIDTWINTSDIVQEESIPVELGEQNVGSEEKVSDDVGTAMEGMSDKGLVEEAEKMVEEEQGDKDEEGQADKDEEGQADKDEDRQADKDEERLADKDEERQVGKDEEGQVGKDGEGQVGKDEEGQVDKDEEGQVDKDEEGQVDKDEESEVLDEEEVKVSSLSEVDKKAPDDADEVSEDILSELHSEMMDDNDTNEFNGNDDEEDIEEDDFEEDEEYWDLDSLDSEGELDALLEEGLPDEYKQGRSAEGKQGKRRGLAGEMWRQAVTHEGALPEGLIGIREKTVLKRRGHDPLEGLPDGWIRISHECGMPLYLHRPTRVCTWSRPYLLGSGSARRHHIPIASIPCLHYSRAQEKDKRLQNEKEMKNKGDGEDTNAKQTTTLQNGKGSEETCSTSKIAGGAGDVPTAEEMKGQESGDQGEKSAGKGQQHGKSKIHICEDESVDGKQLQQYLSKRFEFEKIAIKRFKTWADRRKHNKNLKSKDRPHFPGGPTMIRCQIPGTKKREFVINAQDKTPVCILHEYSQRVMRTQPQYMFQESRNASAPFEAIVEIQGKQYGRGEASSKRMAKAEAARATLDILLPELIAHDKQKSSSDLEYFDHVAIDDGRVYDLCTKAGQLTPWQVLQEYRQRNHGLADTEIKFDVQVRKHQRSQYTLTCGSHTVTGTCKNKNSGKQHGAQKLIKLLHPELTSWGAIIKMYGKGSTEINREKKEAEQSIIELQQGKRHKRPNKKILDKLRMEMMKLYSKTGELVQELHLQGKEAEQTAVDQDDMEEEQT